MKKTFITLFTTGALLLSSSAYSTGHASASVIENEVYHMPTSQVEQVSSSKASVKKGTFKFNYNTNVRLDAGTRHKKVTLATKGSKATATHQKKVGKQTWYRVNVNGKTGWVLSSLLSSSSTKQVAKTSNSSAKKHAGTYKLKYNSNIRRDAGTNNKIVITARKGSVAKASYSKKVGKTTWYKVSVQGKTGWVSSSLLAKNTVKSPAPTKVTKTSNSSATKHSGSYKLKYNSNIRTNAGTNNRIVITARKGSIAKASYSKKVGKTTWYKVNVQGKTGWVSSSLVAKHTPATTKKVTKVSSPSNSSSSVVSIGKSLTGIPYVFGGTSTRGFDCSGFTQYVFREAGINVSRTTTGQFAETTTVSTPQPGDLVFFANTYRSGISHVGIYIGNNHFVHAGGSKSEVRSLNDSYWKSHFHSFKRK